MTAKNLFSILLGPTPTQLLVKFLNSSSKDEILELKSRIDSFLSADPNNSDAKKWLQIVESHLNSDQE